MEHLLTIDKTITLIAESKEPILNQIPPWLNNDNKIIIHLLDI